MIDKKTLLLAQALIALMMSVMMTGFFSFLAFGPTIEWLGAWSRSFLIAWPLAFVLSLFVSRIAFGMAGRLTAGRPS